MLHELFVFYTRVFNLVLNLDVEYKINQAKFTFGGVEFGLNQYLVMLCSYITLIFIVVLCCLFVYKIIKLIGGLIR